MTRALPEWSGATDDAMPPPRVRLNAFRKSPNRAPITADYFTDRSDIDPETGCWLWSGCISAGGYGLTGVRSFPSKLAHRAAYIVLTGNIIPAGMQLCHTCDVRRCINPAHLFIGTGSDNMVDCRDKNRLRTPFYKGMPPTHAKLTLEQARAIKASPDSQRKLAAKHNVSRRTIQFIKSGRSWSAA